MNGQSRRDVQATTAAAAGLASADWRALGTSAHLVVTEPGVLDTARALVEKQLAEIDVAASRFRDDSELTRLNHAGGRTIDVSALFARLIRIGVDAASWTDGLVDPTIGAAIIALGYDRTFVSMALDSPTFVVTTGPVPGWRQIELDDAALRVRVPDGVRVDLGATAKGFAADLCAARVAETLRCGVLVSLGGDIAVAGEPPTGGWPITVTDRSDLDEDAAVVGQVIALHSGGLATSSTQARRWRRGGSRMHHLIDPSSGLPAAGPFRTVSVAASTCVLANTASTAAMILGAQGPGWLTSRGFSARLVRLDGSSIHLGQWPNEGEQR